MAKSFSEEILVLSRPGTHEKSNIELHILKRAFKALSALKHPVRHDILRLIEAKQKVSVKEIYTTLNMAQAVASQHLKILRDARIVTTQRVGKNIYYSLNFSRLEEIARVLPEVA